MANEMEIAGIIKRMEDAGEPVENIRAVVAEWDREQQGQQPAPAEQPGRAPSRSQQQNTAFLENVAAPTMLGNLFGAQQGGMADAYLGAPERTGRVIGGVAGNMASDVGAALMPVLGGIGRGIGWGLGKIGAPDEEIKAAGKKVYNKLGDIARDVDESRLGQLYSMGMEDPATQANALAGRGFAEGISTFGGLGMGGAVGKAGATTLGQTLARRQAAKTAEESIAQPIENLSLRQIEKGTKTPIIQASGDIASVSKVGQPGLPFFKDLSKSETKIMVEPRAEAAIPFTEYAKQAVVHGRDMRALTPGQLAATNATKAFREIEDLTKTTGKEIGDIVEGSTAKVNIADAKMRFLEAADKRLGAMNEADIIADPSAKKAVEDIGNMLLNLPDEITPQNAWRLKRNLRSALKYDAAGQMRPKNSVLEGIQKEVSNLIDERMDEVLPGFKDANARYSQLIKIEDAASRALGPEFVKGSGLTKHGASIMKRALQSNADSNITSIFREIKAQTGGKYDLFQDAAYANIAMRLSGDIGQVRKAAPFGGLFGVKGELLGKTAQGAGSVQDVLRGGKLRRVSEWYGKKQGISPVSTITKTTSENVNIPTTLGGLRKR